jgi:SPP1 gp7 family putative phage head morphogenesis protein
MSDPDDLYALARSFRAQLTAGDRAAQQGITAAWRTARDALLADVRRALAVDEPSAFRLARLVELERQAAAQLARFDAAAAAIITAEQQAALLLAQEHARALIQAAVGETAAVVESKTGRDAAEQADAAPPLTLTLGMSLPVGAIEAAVGFLADGTPVRAALDRYGQQAGREAHDVLIRGIALGSGPHAIARELRAVLATPLVAAQRIARTESLRAYRAASLATYQASASLVESWQWLSARDRRVCANCLSRDGSVWPLDQFFPAHANCRCTLVPVARGAPPRRREHGSEWFARQPDEVQAAVLGPAAHRALKDGAVTLRDFEGWKHDPRWGASTYTRSLRAILGDERAARYQARQDRP